MASHSEALARLLALGPEARRKVIKALPPRQRLRLIHSWEFWGRPAQVWRPGPEMHTVYTAGRGWGKTRVGSEAVRYVAENPELCGGRARRGPADQAHGVGGIIGIAGRTANDVNETMLYGPSGLITISPPWFRPVHNPSRMRLTWPNGVIARLFTGDVPDSFRGPNIGFLWADELAHWRRLAQAWKRAKLMLRHGKRARSVITTTPLGVSTLIELIYRCRDGAPLPAVEGQPSDGVYQLASRVRVIRGSTYDNVANLSEGFVEEIVSSYEGTDEGDQEIHGLVLLGVRGAPFRRDWIHRCSFDDLPAMIATVVGVDPTVSEGELTTENEPRECGIVVVGLGTDYRLYVLEDGSGTMSSIDWAKRAAALYEHYDADSIVVEDNQGGDLVEAVFGMIRRRLRVRRVHATRDKFERAGLVAPAWQLGRVSHVDGPRGENRLIRLEHQMVTADPNRPARSQRLDRMDAVVWAALSLVGDGTDRRRVRALGNVETWRKIAEAVRQRFAS